MGTDRIALGRRSFIGIVTALGQARSQSANGGAQRAAAIVEALRNAKGVPAMAATVWKYNSSAWAGAFGQADVENNAPASAASRFRIGSLSKLITAATAARLYEQHLLDLDAPVQRYVPSFPDKGAPISARMLLGHLAGIRHYGAGEFMNRQSFKSVRETLKIFEASPLLHPPGTKYFYSSYGFNLLGAVIEGASKLDFLTCVQKQVLDPLGMRSTVSDQVDPIIPHRTCFYSRGKDRLLNGPYVDTSDRWPSGGFLSTIDDLGRFGAAHLTDDFLKPQTRELMFTSQRTSDGTETGVGFAWRIGTLDGHKVLHHGGASIGGRSFLLLRPQEGIATVILANLTSAAFDQQQAMVLSDLFA